MAAPNVVNVATITGKNAKVALSSTSATSIISNAAGSGKLLKVNMLRVTNVDGTNACDVSVNVYSAAALGGTAYPIASTISVPADAALDVITKETAIYLEEDQSIGVTAGAANDLVVVASYEEIS